MSRISTISPRGYSLTQKKKEKEGWSEEECDDLKAQIDNYKKYNPGRRNYVAPGRRSDFQEGRAAANRGVVERASEVALSALNPSVPAPLIVSTIGQHDQNFASVGDSSVFNFDDWRKTTSSHGTALESSIPGIDRYNVKVYDDPGRGNVVSIVEPTNIYGNIPNPEHIGDFIGFNLGFPVNAVNSVGVLQQTWQQNCAGKN